VLFYEKFRLEVHLRAVTDAAQCREDTQAAELCNELGFYLHTVGQYVGARPYYERALAIRERVLGPEHPDTATSLNNLGFLLRAQGDLAGARPYYKRPSRSSGRVLAQIMRSHKLCSVIWRLSRLR
jgi:Tfp pilus assembly protein PilF